jgi:hypothetical protein
VCPAKAGMFSRRQSCRGKSQQPPSLDSGVAGNQDLGAYRPGLPWGGASHQAVTKVNAEVAPKVRSLEGRAPNRRAKAVWASRMLTETARPLWRGGSDGRVARACEAPGETLLAPGRKVWSKVSPITGSPGKGTEGERVAEGRGVAVRRGNARRAKAPYC